MPASQAATAGCSCGGRGDEDRQVRGGCQRPPGHGVGEGAGRVAGRTVAARQQHGGGGVEPADLVGDGQRGLDTGLPGQAADHEPGAREGLGHPVADGLGPPEDVDGLPVRQHPVELARGVGGERITSGQQQRTIRGQRRTGQGVGERLDRRQHGAGRGGEALLRDHDRGGHESPASIRSVVAGHHRTSPDGCAIAGRDRSIDATSASVRAKPSPGDRLHDLGGRGQGAHRWFLADHRCPLRAGTAHV